MPNPRESDLQNRNAVVSDNDTSSSSSPATAVTSPPKPIFGEHREFPLVYNPADRPRRSSPNRENNNKNKSDDAGPQSPSSVQTPRPHGQISHTPSGQESSAFHDTGAQPLDPSSTFQERLSALEAVWQSAESSVSRLGAALEKREDGKTVGEERRSPDRFFVIDEATRVEDHERESDERARVEGRAGKRKRSSEAEDAPTMRREGTKEGDRERRIEELREGLLEEEGKL
ncbi:MAG: hypothetical protein OHK93_005191 [Ramalina farinacea]|uniref:Uncharacterized protein n=1 Tax=Ramalina farinacea TaxID=258253 RepID=A0AA43QW52_9LECA|nr:hypothetical protein [Ramalina farinacea]